MKKEENDIQEAWSIGDARDEPEPLTRPGVISHATDPPRRLKPSKVSQRSEAKQNQRRSRQIFGGIGQWVGDRWAP